MEELMKKRRKKIKQKLIDDDDIKSNTMRRNVLPDSPSFYSAQAVKPSHSSIFFINTWDAVGINLFQNMKTESEQTRNQRDSTFDILDVIFFSLSLAC